MFRWFENRLNPYPASIPTQPPTSLFAFCRHYIRGLEKWLLLMALLSAAIAILEVSLYSFIGSIVDRLNANTPSTFLSAEGSTMAIMAIVVLLGMPLLHLAYSTIVHQTLLGNFPMRIRWQIHRYLLRQSLGYFQDEFAGRVVTKVMQTSLAVRETVIKLLDVANYVLVYLAGTLVVAASADWRLMLPFATWLILYSLFMYYFIPRLNKAAREQADARASMTGRLVDSYTNITTIKLFSHSSREESYARQSMDLFLQAVHKQMRLITKIEVINAILNMLLLTSVATLSIALWMNGTTTVGHIAVVLAFAMRLLGMSQWLMWETSALFENIGTIQDGIDSISVPATITDASDATELQNAKGGIHFEQISFHYGKNSGVIEQLDLQIKPGERVGLVGRSGAGKSTLVNLLMRFYDCEQGRILIDGIDITTLTQDSLRANIGMVTQDTSLLHRSVYENLLYGQPDATHEQVEQAVRLARADAFIPQLRDGQGRTGYDAHVGERGLKLSGGQRQRIAIARVLLKNAPILILDEATSALDSEAEAAIQENLNQLMQSKTVIAIAHRLSTIAAMDRLVVMDQGRIIEQGTHAQLLEREGLYAQLWQRQSGGFLADNVDTPN